VIVVYWRIYEKAEQPGWACIIPIYNLVVLMRIIGKSGWLILLYFIPIVNIVFSIIVAINLAKVFGKSTAFGVLGLWLFAIVGYLILAFGDARYRGLPGTLAPVEPLHSGVASTPPASS
jgi:hypothetical protein